MSKQRYTLFIFVILHSILNFISTDALASDQEVLFRDQCASNAQSISPTSIQKQLMFFKYLDSQNGNDGKYAKNLDTSVSDEDALAKYLNIYKVSDRLKNICHLSDAEIIALTNYTDGGFSTLNFFLRLKSFEAFLDFVKQKMSPLVLNSNAISQAQEQFDSQISYRDILDAALDHLQVHEGEVYRGIMLSPSKREHLKAGEIFTDPAFMSTSMVPEVASQFGIGPEKVFFVIESSHNGHKIQFFSVRKEEQEVLFKSHSKFKITRTAEMPDGGLKVWMTEISL